MECVLWCHGEEASISSQSLELMLAPPAERQPTRDLYGSEVSLCVKVGPGLGSRGSATILEPGLLKDQGCTPHPVIWCFIRVHRTAQTSG